MCIRDRVYGLAKLINENQVPERLKGARIYGMDMGQMLSLIHIYAAPSSTSMWSMSARATGKSEAL